LAAAEEARHIAYNWCVDKPAMPNRPRESVPERSPGRELRRALCAETIGIIVIALVILVFTILRYGAHINWSAR
jgi:hypothetical protein